MSWGNLNTYLGYTMSLIGQPMDRSVSILSQTSLLSIHLYRRGGRLGWSWGIFDPRTLMHTRHPALPSFALSHADWPISALFLVDTSGGERFAARNEILVVVLGVARDHYAFSCTTGILQWRICFWRPEAASCIPPDSYSSSRTTFRCHCLS